MQMTCAFLRAEWMTLCPALHLLHPHPPLLSNLRPPFETEKRMQRMRENTIQTALSDFDPN